jgi:hypothetical protein
MIPSQRNMDMISLRLAPRLLSLLVVLLVASCGSNPSPDDPIPSPAPARAPARAPWTTAFLSPSLLVATEIQIVGPEDLLEHVAVRQATAHVSYETKTVEEGLLQTLVVVGEGNDATIKVQLDGWGIVALRRLTILQRPGEVPVTVRAIGEAWWSAVDGSEERREAVLRFEGERGK